MAERSGNDRNPDRSMATEAASGEAFKNARLEVEARVRRRWKLNRVGAGVLKVLCFIYAALCVIGVSAVGAAVLLGVAALAVFSPALSVDLREFITGSAQLGGGLDSTLWSVGFVVWKISVLLLIPCLILILIGKAEAAVGFALMVIMSPGGLLMYFSAAVRARPDDISELVRVGLLRALEFLEPWMVGASISFVVAVIPGLMLWFREVDKEMRRAGYL